MDRAKANHSPRGRRPSRNAPGIDHRSALCREGRWGFALPSSPLAHVVRAVLHRAAPVERRERLVKRLFRSASIPCSVLSGLRTVFGATEQTHKSGAKNEPCRRVRFPYTPTGESRF